LGDPWRVISPRAARFGETQNCATRGATVARDLRNLLRFVSYGDPSTTLGTEARPASGVQSPAVGTTTRRNPIGIARTEAFARQTQTCLSRSLRGRPRTSVSALQSALDAPTQRDETIARRLVRDGARFLRARRRRAPRLRAHRGRSRAVSERVPPHRLIAHEQHVLTGERTYEIDGLAAEHAAEVADVALSMLRDDAEVDVAQRGSRGRRLWRSRRSCFARRATSMQKDVPETPAMKLRAR